MQVPARVAPLTWGVTLADGHETTVSKTLTFAVGSSDPESSAYADAARG